MKESFKAGDILSSALSEERPIGLFLGQDSWNAEAEPDAVLLLALQRLGREQEIGLGWPALAGSELIPEGYFEWLAERFSRRPVSQWLEVIARFPWSAIFTTSIDPSIREAFASVSREPQVILTADEVPIVGRSTARTPIYHLFSRSGHSDPLARPPRNKAELRTRLMLQATPMLSRMPDAVTSLGLVVLDGYRSERDWLNLDALLAVAHQLSTPIIWCGWRREKEGSKEDLLSLVNDGRIIPVDTRLSSLLGELEANTPNLRRAFGSVDSSTVSFVEGKSFNPSPEMRIRVEAVTNIVDDSWMDFLAPLGGDAEYAAFRRFHGDTEGPRGLVSGVRRKFAIARDFEGRLWQLVSGAIDDHSRLSGPIVVHGQSGAGKSIALARLVASIRADKRAAVLYSTARIPQTTDIDQFCASAEECGAAATVVICDSNASESRYRELLVGLRSRGRKVVLVGSSYKQVDESLPRSFVTASDVLSETERNQLFEMLVRLGGEKDYIAVGNDTNVLATLYRALPASRMRLSAGLGREARATEETLRQRGSIPAKKAKSQIAEALIAAGLATENEAVLESIVVDPLISEDDSAGRVIDFVMAAGRISSPIPINLLMRAVASSGIVIDYTLIERLFRGLDLFRWRVRDNEGEEILVGPRITLEAELICRRRLLNAAGEGDRLVQLVSAARLSWDAGGGERRFLLDLIHKMGPDGPLSTRYKESYLNAARALTQLRQRYGVNDPSLMLQEAALRRLAIREDQVGASDALAILEEARAAVQAGLDQLGSQSGRGSRRARANLSNERAAIYGFLANFRASQLASPQEVWSAYQAARTAARAAVGLRARPEFIASFSEYWVE